jgi:hypothetical protein
MLQVLNGISFNKCLIKPSENTPATTKNIIGKIKLAINCKLLW